MIADPFEPLGEPSLTMPQNSASYLPLRTVQPRSAIPVAQALQQSSSLAGLAARARQSGECLRLVSPLLPPTMLTGVQAGPLQDGHWCLLASNSAVAAKLRQLAPALLAHLRTHGHPVQEIRVKIAMRTA